MNTELRIQTPEGITFAYPLAGMTVRCVAWAIDMVAIVTLTYTASIVSLVGGLVIPDFAQALLTLLFFVISIGYGVAMEWVWRGQTIGKRMMRLRVMDVRGLRLQFHQVLMRNLLRFVDMLPLFYAVGAAACLFSRRAQRLGDLAANTVVVRLLRYGEPDLDQLLAGKFNSLRQFPHLVGRLRQRVSPVEARLALQALVRRDELDPPARVALFSELAGHLRALVVFPPEAVEAVPDEQYVRNVVDVLFRTKPGSETPARVREAAAG